jgi:hypothetical protein
MKYAITPLWSTRLSRGDPRRLGRLAPIPPHQRAPKRPLLDTALFYIKVALRAYQGKPDAAKPVRHHRHPIDLSST